MRRGLAVAGLGLLAGCITTSVRESDYRIFLWPEWTPMQLSLLESVETYPVPYRILVLKTGFFVGHGPPAPANTVARTAPPVTSAPFTVSAPAVPAPAKPEPPREQDGVAVEYANTGTSVSFAASADGTPPFSFQWQKDGRPVSGATQATLTLKSIKASDEGIYVCHVRNAVGSQVSPPVKLIVRSP